LELAAGAILIAVLAAVFSAPPPRPLSPAQAWNLRAAGPLSDLAADVAGAVSGQPVPGNDSRLAADVARVRRIGPPPAPAAAQAWQRAISDVSNALSTRGAAAQQHLAQAGLELVTVSVDTRT
jgi:hypothetical protein